MYNKGNNLKTSFSLWAKMLKNMYILGYLGGPEGVFNDQTGPILLSSYPLNSVARDLPRTGSETNTTIFVIYIYWI